MTTTQRQSRLLSPLRTRAEAHREHDDYACDLSFDEVDDRFIWVRDGDRRIGLIDKRACTLEMIAPHPEREPLRAAAIPTNYHAPTYQGGRVVFQWWIDDGSHRVDAHEALAEPAGVLVTHPGSRRPETTIQLGQWHGESLSFKATHHYEGDGRIAGWHDVTIGYDAAVGSYVADIEAELVAPYPYVSEFCNFYAGGVYDNRSEQKRYACTIWQHPDKGLLRWNHNPVSYLTPGVNNRDGQRRIAAGGFLGYFTDPHTNPVVEITEAASPLMAATCSNLYDEHLICLPPEKPGVDGLYRWAVKCRLLSLPPEVAESVVREAKPIEHGIDPSLNDPILHDPDADDQVFGRRFARNPRFPLFADGRVNDFERPVDLESTVVGSMVWASSSPDNKVYWDEKIGHSGHRSIRLRGDLVGEVTSTRNAGGPTPHVYAGRSYRLSGWVRCERVTGGGASIRFDLIGQHPTDPLAVHRAGPVRGDADWILVETTFETGPDADLGWFQLELDGPGKAWFDDVAIELC